METLRSQHGDTMETTWATRRSVRQLVFPTSALPHSRAPSLGAPSVARRCAHERRRLNVGLAGEGGPQAENLAFLDVAPLQLGCQGRHYCRRHRQWDIAPQHAARLHHRCE